MTAQQGGRWLSALRNVVGRRIVLAVVVVGLVGLVLEETTRPGGPRIRRWFGGQSREVTYTPPPVATCPVDDQVDPDFAPEQLWLQATPLLCEPPTVAAQEAEELVDDDELVLGVVLHGEARAYPLNRMSGPQDEVLNDRIQGEPVLVTWCLKSGSGIVHSRLVDGQELTFRCAGLWRQNMLFRDEESGSIWSQLVGRAVSGPRRGTQLKPLASQVMGWSDWRRLHPETRVMVRPRTATQFRCGPEHLTPQGLAVGVCAGSGSVRVWPLREIKQAKVVNGYVGDEPVVLAYDPAIQVVQVRSRQVDGEELTFRGSDGLLVDDRTGTLWDPREGEAVEGPLLGRVLRPVPAIQAFQEVWSLFGFVPTR
ncbi:MAG: hypothetical protein KatS3mg108_0971 [Isosphaeraceae bacterium]|jgi:hypothetical protein|nr:MAG: hypothetical protein KatS3mg108_0971 [Isosphaeraceae bacterium]